MPQRKAKKSTIFIEAQSPNHAFNNKLILKAGFDECNKNLSVEALTCTKVVSN